MNKYLFFLLLISKSLFSQEPVQPVVSEDYLSLLRRDTLTSASGKPDSIQIWRLKEMYRYKLPVSRVKVTNKQVSIEPLLKKHVEFGGVFTSVLAMNSANRSPSVQNTYAQGRSFGGSLRWQGPETGEMFSFGPPLSALEYEGVPDLYDPNGKLVSRGAGIGLNAIAFDNDVLRNGILQNQALAFRISQTAGYYKKWNIQLKAGTGTEGMIMQQNSNSSENISANFEAVLKKLSVSGGYAAFKTSLSNDNRGGFLNRVYQNSLLTPATFNNAYQKELSPGVQARYGVKSDNPEFLLNENGHYSNTLQQTGSVSAKFKRGKLTVGAGSTLEGIELNSDESLKTGTTFFEMGAPLTRAKDDRRFVIDGFAELAIRYNNGKYTSTAKAAYARGEALTDISYAPLAKLYRYERSVNEVLWIYQTNYNGGKIDGALNLGNKTYSSSTFTRGAYFLPNIDGFLRFRDLFGYGRSPLKISATYNKFYTEVSPSISYAWYSSTQLKPENAFLFFPIEEASGFNALRPVKNSEFTSKIEMFDNYRFQLIASFFSTKSKDEVLPVTEGAAVVLKNLADIHSTGGELEFSQRAPWSKNFRLSQTISISKWSNKVTRVVAGYNYTPVAGFANVNKALVEGQPLGVLVGNSYLKDPKGNTVIGNDGYPIANTSTSVIGNPIPDFTLKLSQILSLKRKWALNLDWEYKKGGDVWNGTRALLDYYGRSENSAIERTVTNYLFKGVDQDGKANTIPVSFYDPAFSVEQSKWLRYGFGGVATDYIEKGDAIRLRNISATYTLPIKKLAQRVRFTAYAKNIVIWTAYKGVDPDQLMFDQANAQGLDFFNLPSAKTFGVNVSLQF